MEDALHVVFLLELVDEGQNLGGPHDVLITSLSHNRWNGEPSWVYRPTYEVVYPPPDDPNAAMRCGLGHCR